MSDHRKAQLCDFGLATAVQEAVEEEEAHTGLTTNVGFTGSIRWCSPEIMAGDKKTRENDMWSWGCLVLEVYQQASTHRIVANYPTFLI